MKDKTMYNRKTINISKVSHAIANGMLAPITANNNLKIRLDEIKEYFDMLPTNQTITDEIANRFNVTFREGFGEYYISHFNDEDLEYTNSDGTCGSSFTLVESDGFDCGSSNEKYPRDTRFVFMQLTEQECKDVELWNDIINKGDIDLLTVLVNDQLNMIKNTKPVNFQQLKNNLRLKRLAVKLDPELYGTFFIAKKLKCSNGRCFS
tara:strand:+ start:376 stop:996 length:621 start_codon:yes stop_codon:yes gene_type:complete